MPIILVSATCKEKRGKGVDFDKYGFYKCPVYKYKRRTDKYYIFTVNLRCDGSTGGS
jgi:dynein heavy chain